MTMRDLPEIEALRSEIQRLLAAGLTGAIDHDHRMRQRDELHLAETERRDELHIAESGRRDALHVTELERRERMHVDEMALLAAAIDSRDIIGQAKGVIMVTIGCSADEAFQLLKAQSQHENRKLVDVAVEIATRAGSGRSGPAS